MKFKGTLWMTAAFIGIVLYYFLLEIPGEKKKKEAKELSEKILAFKTEDVEELSFIRKDQTTALQRQGKEIWNVVQPLKTKADSFAAETFLDKLQSAAFSRVVEEEPADLAPYGLKEPSLKISIKLKDRNPLSLSLGDNSPLGHSLYIKRDDQKKVSLAAGSRSEWEKSLFDLRDKTILPYNTADVTEAEIQRSGTTVRLVKKDKTWTVAGTTPARGDAREIENLLNSTRAARIAAFVDEDPKDLSAYGLDSPAIKLTVATEGKGEPQTLSIGSQNEQGKYYAKTGSQKNVFAADKLLADSLSKSDLDFMDKSLLEFKEENVAELNLRAQGETIRILRDKKDSKPWRIDQPIQTPADAATVHSLLLDLKEARVQSYVESVPRNLKAYGLDAPQKQFTLVSTENKSSGFILGNKTVDGKSYFAARHGETPVFVLPEETADKIFRSIHDLRDRKLLKLGAEAVAKIAIEYPGKTFEVGKSGENWSLLKPEAIKEIKPIVGKDLLWALNSLEFETAGEPPLAKAEAGLDRPAVKITLWDGQNKTLATLLVGKPAEDQNQRYAQVEGNPALYRIKERFLSELPKDIERFRK